MKKTENHIRFGSDIFTARYAADKALHVVGCAVCRDDLRPDKTQRLYAVKNSRTREFVHVLVNGKNLEDTLGWPKNEILYAILKTDGTSKGPPMSEEVKARLRENGEKKKAENKLKRLVRANTPARLVEGEQEKKEGQPMATKKKMRKAGGAKTVKKMTKARSNSGADAFLPARFVRKHSGEDHVFERDGDGWKLDGDGPMPLRYAMAKLMGANAARATSFVRYFKADKITAA